MFKKTHVSADFDKTDDAKIDIPISPKVKKLLGAVTLPGNFNYKKELAMALVQKFKAV